VEAGSQPASRLPQLAALRRELSAVRNHHMPQASSGPAV